MPGLTGVDLAREIHKADGDCIIIFLTSSDEFHRDAFEVEALQYLDKPVDKTKLYRTLDRAVRYIGDKRAERLPVQTKDGFNNITINQIVYVESFHHVLTFHLRDGSTTQTMDSSLSLGKLTEALLFPPFCVPYRGFIVNLNHVDCLQKFRFSMSTGDVIPIPQKHFSQVRQQYSDYLLTRYTEENV
jgi:DNA-binding LytR/AlgR family response regulator